MSTRAGAGKLPTARPSRSRAGNQRGQALIQLTIMLMMLLVLAISNVKSAISPTNIKDDTLEGASCHSASTIVGVVASLQMDATAQVITACSFGVPVPAINFAHGCTL